MFKIELGKIAKDKITGFKGIVMGRAEYLTGCKKYAIQPQKLNKDNKPSDWEWFDEMNMEEVAGRGIKKEPSVGGPMRFSPPKS